MFSFLCSIGIFLISPPPSLLVSQLLQLFSALYSFTSLLCFTVSPFVSPTQSYSAPLGNFFITILIVMYMYLQYYTMTLNIYRFSKCLLFSICDWYFCTCLYCTCNIYCSSTISSSSSSVFYSGHPFYSLCFFFSSSFFFSFVSLSLPYFWPFFSSSLLLFHFLTSLLSTLLFLRRQK